MQPKLGILAGGGELPRLLIGLCQSTDRDYFVIAFDGQAAADVVDGSPHQWINIAAAGDLFDTLRRENVKDLVMAGRIQKPALADIRPDIRGAKFLLKIGKRYLGDDSLLSAIAEELAGEGFRILGVHEILDDLVTPVGLIGQHRPDGQAEADIKLGIQAARAIGAKDIGQGVIVRNGIVIASETSAGTDFMINDLTGQAEGGVLVKVVKPGQDHRIDLPTIGVTTVENITAIGLKGIAVEAGHTLLVDRMSIAKAADMANVFVIGIEADIDDGDGDG
jgi:DUF1009 family protein